MAHLHGGQEELVDGWGASVLFNLSLSIGCLSALKTQLLESSRVGKTQESKVGGNALYNLVLKVTHCPFYPILFVGSESLNAAHISGEGVYPSPWERRNVKEFVHVF